MKKCAFIIPYYGRLPQYFPIFLRSCGKNVDFDWLVFTDDHTAYDYPANVHVYYETFADMQRRVSQSFPFHPELKTPYKLCDLKPMYGYLFAEYLAGYRFWGYCDCDIIFGNLSKFITEDMLSRYDKIFPLGHLSLMRNTEENNRRFMLPLDGEPLYRKVLQSDNIFTFDESYLPTNINRIYQEYGFPIDMEDCSGNVHMRSPEFVIRRYVNELGTFMTEAPMHAVYVWEYGSLKRYYVKFGKIEINELMYMHFQRRRMRMMADLTAYDRIKVLPGSFEPLEVESISVDNFNSIVWKREGDLMAHRRGLVRGDVLFWCKKITNRIRSIIPWNILQKIGSNRS